MHWRPPASCTRVARPTGRPGRSSTGSWTKRAISGTSLQRRRHSWPRTPNSSQPRSSGARALQRRFRQHRSCTRLVGRAAGRATWRRTWSAARRSCGPTPAWASCTRSRARASCASSALLLRLRQLRQLSSRGRRPSRRLCRPCGWPPPSMTGCVPSARPGTQEGARAAGTSLTLRASRPVTKLVTKLVTRAAAAAVATAAASLALTRTHAAARTSRSSSVP